MRLILLLFLFIPLFTSCELIKSENQETSQISSQPTNEEYSVLTPGNRYSWGGVDYYVDKVQSIMTKRCASCHSCTAGPCQLNLTSYEGVARGLSKENPYDRMLFFQHKRARLEDHFTVEQLRQQGFYPVVADTGDPKRNEQESIMFLALEHGEKNYTKEFSEDTTLTTKNIRKLGLAQEEMDYQCPVNPKEYKKFKRDYPDRGMPYGCPALDEKNLKTLKDWLREGGKGPTVKSAEILKTPQQTFMTSKGPMYMVDLFEKFLNQDSYARQAVSRYIYEHSWVANIHFKHNPGEFYRIVRSRTNAPLPIDLIVTEFPTDHPGPGVNRVYYRLEKLDRVIEMKKHVLWRVDEKTIDSLDKTFFSTDWSLTKKPPYTSNPFDWFNAIPARKRAHFVAKHAQIMWQSIGRGSICHGRLPSSVGSDYAWYFTLDPDSDPSVLSPKLGMKNYSKFYAHPDDQLKAAAPNAVSPGALAFKKAFEKTLRKLKPEGLGIEDVYKGDFYYGLRHETAMEFYSIKDGNKILGYPRYKLILPYAIHEAFYYRTAVHYRWYGSLAHDFTAYATAIYGRTLAEDIFVSLHPDQKERTKLRNFYTNGSGKAFFRLGGDYANGRPSKLKVPITYEDITLKLLEHVTGKPSRNLDDLNNWPIDTHEKKIYPEIFNLDQWEAGLRTLTGKTAPYTKFVPNVVHIRLEGEYVYTLIGERGHKNHKMPKMEFLDRDPKNDIVRAFRGYIGSFPHLFIELSFEDASGFLKEFQTIDNLADWTKFISKYKIPRNSERFWPFVDWIHDYISKTMKEEGAVVDLRNYDIRAKPF